MKKPSRSPSPQTSSPEPQNTKSQTPTSYRAKGKIASLPKAQRDLINQLLRDGATYVEVCRQMAQQGLSLNTENVSNWHNGPGFQDWLFHQEWRDDSRSLQESALDLMEGSEPAKFNQAALHMATLQVFAALRHLRRGRLDDKLGGDSAAFSRLVNALSRATRESLQAQKYIDACAKARAALLPLKDPKRKLSEDERHAIVHQVDEILGLDEDPVPDPAAQPNPALGIITLHRPGEPTEPVNPPAPSPPDSSLITHNS